MKSTKNCPQCGNDFEGRNNKMYCSDKCKMAAFKQSHEEVPIEEDEDVFVSTKPILANKRERNSFQDNFNGKDIALEVELKKLELEHLRTLAAIASEEKDKERSFELSKMRLAFEQQKEVEKIEIPSYEPEEDEVVQEEEIPIILPKLLKKEYKELVQIFS